MRLPRGLGARISRPWSAPGAGPGTRSSRFSPFPPEVRTGDLHRTNAIESVNAKLRYDHQDAQTLPQRRCGHQADLAGPAEHHWRTGDGRDPTTWKSAMNQFAILLRNMVHEIEHVRYSTHFTQSVKVQSVSHTESGRALHNCTPDGFLPQVSMPTSRPSRCADQVARRSQIDRHRTRLNNEIHAVLAAPLIPSCPASDLFGRKGRI